MDWNSAEAVIEEASCKSACLFAISSYCFPLASARTSLNRIMNHSLQLWAPFGGQFCLQSLLILSPLVKNPLYYLSLDEDFFLKEAGIEKGLKATRTLMIY